MAIFIANLAYNTDVVNEAKLGILSASVFSAIVGTALLALLTPNTKSADKKESDYSSKE